MNLPEEFLQQSKAIFQDDHEAFIQSLSETAPISLRINPRKNSGAFANEEVIPWSTNGRYLQTRPSFTLDPLFHAGCYYVQEASSQFLEQCVSKVLSEIEVIHALDMCASPGGKSTHLLSLLPENATLVSNEIIPNRNNILKENLIKWGLPNIIITQSDSASFKKGAELFDLVVVDAPCSGEGLIRKDPDAINEWSLNAVSICAERQTEILSNIKDTVREGGFLIYSTCTYEPSENENQIRYLIENDFEIIKVNSSEGIVENEFGYHFYPHKIKGEGFFISLLRKKGEHQTKSFKKKISTGKKEELFRKYFTDENLIITNEDEKVFALTEATAQLLPLLNKIYIKRSGIFVGENIHNKFQPSDELAFSIKFNHDSLEKIELTKDDALIYLRGESIPLNNLSDGIKLITHQNFGLGFIKMIGKRMNNYYPKEFRIRLK